MNSMLRNLLLIGALILITGMVMDYFRIGFDDTDNATTGTRSSMVVYTDHKTGCQYLGRMFAGLTPRLDAQGKPVCREPR